MDQQAWQPDSRAYPVADIPAQRLWNNRSPQFFLYVRADDHMSQYGYRCAEILFPPGGRREKNSFKFYNVFPFNFYKFGRFSCCNFLTTDIPARFPQDGLLDRNKSAGSHTPVSRYILTADASFAAEKKGRQFFRL